MAGATGSNENLAKEGAELVNFLLYFEARELLLIENFHPEQLFAMVTVYGRLLNEVGEEVCKVMDPVLWPEVKRIIQEMSAKSRDIFTRVCGNLTQFFDVIHVLVDDHVQNKDVTVQEFREICGEELAELTHGIFTNEGEEMLRLFNLGSRRLQIYFEPKFNNYHPELGGEEGDASEIKSKLEFECGELMTQVEGDMFSQGKFSFSKVILGKRIRRSLQTIQRPNVSMSRLWEEAETLLELRWKLSKMKL